MTSHRWVGVVVVALAVAAASGQGAYGAPDSSQAVRAHLPQLSRDAEVESPAPALPAAPGWWPSELPAGVASPPGAARDQAAKGFGVRYQYLAGGVNTGSGWANWNPDGSFVSDYIEESSAAGMVPVFSYYMLRQSLPGSDMEESDGVGANLRSASTMRDYFADLELFFLRAAAFPNQRVILHLEPDTWAYMQQAGKDDDARTVPVAVDDSGHPRAAGYANNAAGLAQAVVAMRGELAPNVSLAYHQSWWGTGEDPVYSDPPDPHMRELAERSAAFYLSLGARFDLVFMEFSDRDAAFKQYVYGDGGASWWDADDFRRHRDFIAATVQLTGLRVVLWQIPQGNTRMRAMDNTWNHYQDNRVEWLFGDAGFSNLQGYVDAGVIGLLFGRGADGATCACDANNDGVTNPPPINGNSRPSLSADDDGGYFAERMQAYFSAGRLALH